MAFFAEFDGDDAIAFSEAAQTFVSAGESGALIVSEARATQDLQTFMPCRTSSPRMRRPTQMSRNSSIRKLSRQLKRARATGLGT